MNQGKRETFGSRFGAIAVVGGSAVGLGNIWKFPYVAGENGGAAFIITYIIISFLISVPVMLSEFAIGREGRRNVLGAFRAVTPQKGWQSIGYLGVLCALVLLSFYSVISGWALEFVKESVMNNFAGKDAAQVTEYFGAFVDSGWQPVLWTLGFLLINCVILAFGVHKGIERYSKVLMPMLAFMLVGLAVASMFLSGFDESARFLFKPDFSKITGGVVVQALGQSFFSMSIGMGTMITYGSYIGRRDSLFRIASTVAVADVVMAMFAGMAIFPAVFTYGISPTSGPELVFITLPTLFAQIPGGYFISIIFFLLIVFAALTSAFSLLEVIMAYLSEEFRMSRPLAGVVSFFAVGALAVPCALSQVEGSGVRIMGWSLFDFFDNLASNLMLPLGGFAIVIFVGWFYDRKTLRNQITTGGMYGNSLYSPLMKMIRYVVPVAIVVMFLSLIKVI